MTQEEKQLLLIDLCARLPYGLKVQLIDDPEFSDNPNPCDVCLSLELLQKYGNWSLYRPFIIKPYLRSMSSMTEEELEECRATCKYRQAGQSVLDCATPQTIDYLISHHFDYRGLIEKGLALEAPEEMYK